MSTIRQSSCLERIRTLEQSYRALQSDLPFLDERIGLLRTVIASPVVTKNTSLASPLNQWRHDLANALYTRFLHVREVDDLTEARDLLRDNLKMSPQLMSNSFPHDSSLLGSVLRERAWQLETSQGLGEALLLHREALADNKCVSVREQAYHSRELGHTLFITFMLAKSEVSHLNESIQSLRDALRLYENTGEDDLHSKLCLSAALHQVCHHVTRDKACVEEAELLARSAASSCDLNSRDLYWVRHTLSNVLRTLAWFFDDMSALNEVIELLRDVLNNAPLGWTQLLTVAFAPALVMRFRKYGHEDDISESLNLMDKQLARVNSSHKYWADLQERHCSALFTRFQISGAPEDIEESIRAIKLSLFTECAGATRLNRLNSLAACRGVQYNSFGDIAHLNECIRYLEEIMHSAPLQGQSAQDVVGNLLTALEIRYRETRRPQDLEQALRLVDDFYSAWNRRSANTQGYLAAAGDIILLQFENTHSIDDLERATKIHQEALEGCARGSGAHRRRIIDYAKTLRIRYEVLGEDNSAVRADELLQEVCSVVPEVHPDRAHTLCALARLHLCKDVEGKNVDQALGFLLQAVNSPYCSAYRRVKDALDVLTYLCTRDRPSPHLSNQDNVKLLTVYSSTIELLPQVASFGLGTQSRLKIIAAAGQLTTYGATHAISLRRLDRALEILEAGRGIFWSQGLQLRTQFSSLPDEIGNKLTKISRALGQPLPDSLDGSEKDRELARRRQLGNEFRSILAEARLLPGFENLLKNADFDSLALAVKHHHTIVVLIAGEKASHAIIVHVSAEPGLVMLPSVNIGSLRALVSHLGDYNHQTNVSRGARKAVSAKKLNIDVYQELWTSVMHPIIKEMRWHKATGRQRPRLILCPTGVFMQLPLHAAGIYTGFKPVCCSDYFVPSYIPSIGALLHAQTSTHPVRRVDAETLVVAVHHPCQGSALPMTAEEASAIQNLVPSKIVQISTCSDVLENLKSASILHLACHGSQDLTDALQSGFFLDDGLLTVSKLMELELPNAFLAVLSACETAKGDAAQPDQAIHLAAAMLFAGFKSVIATMWYMGDLDGPVIAEGIYSALFDPNKESEFLDPNDIPYALDEAIQKLRNSGLDPSFWATYIHIGI